MKAYSELDLYPTVTNMELVRAISYTTSKSNFMILDQLSFELSCKTHTHTHTHTHTPNDFYLREYLAFFSSCKKMTF